MDFLRRGLLGFAIGLLLCSAAMAAGEDFSLTILSTNDIHAHLSPIDPMGVMCDQKADAAGTCQGGVARLATAIARERAKGVPTLLLDAGDQFSGTLYFTQYKGEPLAVFMNALGYDAMTLGNHEFDDGPATLAAFIKALHFPVVAANVNLASSPELRGLTLPFVVKKVAGRKVGIIGLTHPKTPEMSSPGPGITFEDVLPPVRRAVRELKHQRVPIIIVLSHAGLEADKRLAAAVPGLDVIVGGHSHKLLGNGLPGAVGPSPLVVPHGAGSPTLIVTAGFWGRYLGVLHVTFDAAGRLAHYDGNPVLLDAAMPEDPAIVTALARYAQPLAALRAAVVGRTDTALDAAGCRRDECLPGDLLAEAMLAAARKDGAVAAMAASRSIRAGIPAGTITRADVLTAFSRPSTLVTVSLTGRELAAILEAGLGRPERHGRSGRFLQVAGLRYAYDLTRPAGDRLTKVQIADAKGWFTPLEPEARYRVALSSFLSRGGGGFAVPGRDRRDTGRPLTDVVADYLQGHTPLDVALDGRIRRAVGDD